MSERSVRQWWRDKQAAADALDGQEDVSVGLKVMETVYAVAIVLGFKNALEKSYELVISPFEGPPARLPHAVLVIALLAIMLLGSRFFWVPRNLHAFAYESPRRTGSRPRRLTMYHFPITLAHAVLFFCVCQAWVEIVKSEAHTTSPMAHDLVIRFIELFAALLLLNGVWLLATFRLDRKKPETRWGISNVVFALLIFLGVAIATSLFHKATDTLLLTAALLFLLNGVLDVLMAGKAYMVFPTAPQPPSPPPSPPCQPAVSPPVTQA